MTGYEPSPISLEEIFSLLCPDCKAKVKAMVREKVNDLITNQVLGIDKPKEKKKVK